LAGLFFYNRTDHVFFQNLGEKTINKNSSHGTRGIRWASAAMALSSACGPSAPVLLEGACLQSHGWLLHRLLLCRHLVLSSRRTLVLSLRRPLVVSSRCLVVAFLWNYILEKGLEEDLLLVAIAIARPPPLSPSPSLLPPLPLPLCRPPASSPSPSSPPSCRRRRAVALPPPPSSYVALSCCRHHRTAAKLPPTSRCRAAATAAATALLPLSRCAPPLQRCRRRTEPPP
jgi:hypothetical protein